MGWGEWGGGPLVREFMKLLVLVPLGWRKGCGGTLVDGCVKLGVLVCCLVGNCRWVLVPVGWGRRDH